MKLKLLQKILYSCILIQVLFLFLNGIISSFYFKIFITFEKSMNSNCSEFIFKSYWILSNKYFINAIIALYYLCILVSLIILIYCIYKKYKKDKSNEIPLIKCLISFIACIICYPLVMVLITNYIL
jgi:hypothetical protein